MKYHGGSSAHVFCGFFLRVREKQAVYKKLSRYLMIHVRRCGKIQ